MEIQSSSNQESLFKKIAKFKDMHPSDIAEQLEDLEIDEIRDVLRELSEESNAEIITELPHETQTELLEKMRVERVAEIIPEMYSDDAADALSDISPERLSDIMEVLPDTEEDEITELLEHDKESAGGIMRKEVLAVQEDFTLAQAREAIRTDEDQDDDSAIYVYVVDSENRLRGVLRLRDLLFRDLRLKVKEVMMTDVRTVNIAADQEQIANLFQKYNFIAIPVVDDFGALVGIVTSDDVIDVIQEEATEDMQRMVGLSGEEGINTPWKRSVNNRLPWLCVNLGTAFLAAWIVSLFESSIEKYAVLAIFLPIVAGQGGNAGSQTLTIMVRSLALGEIEGDEWRKVLVKEILIGLVSGLTIGLIVGVLSWLWKGDVILGGVVFLAMLLNMLAAALSGVLVPIALKAIRVDPALASTIMVTTVTDVLGFFIFLSLATMAFKIWA
ncbi:magnesium transporter [Puniceicoccaceae bacterium K14]|nr:magnesium transporter [Puniceicoccaceae bacterium K14]